MKKLLAFPLILLLLVLPVCALAEGTPQDGLYTVNVTLSGGSGRASVASPAKMTVTNGASTAIIIWSSPHYDFMLVGGEYYYPISKEGNSTFQIPVTALDTDIAISAETTAMSEPHVIDYTLRFDSSSLKAAGKNTDTAGIVTIAVVTVAVVAAAAVAFVVILAVRHRKRNA
jgi:hypothetical protein